MSRCCNKNLPRALSSFYNKRLAFRSQIVRSQLFSAELILDYHAQMCVRCRGIKNNPNIINKSGQGFSLANACMPGGIACNRRTHARTYIRRARMHENWGRAVHGSPREARLRRGCAIRVFAFELGNHARVVQVGLGISEIIISQSLAGWQICRRGVKCQLLRDRGT